MLWVLVIFVSITSVELAPNEPKGDIHYAKNNCTYGTSFRKKYYVQTFEPMTWWAAAEYCFNRDWQLANPVTKEEDKDVRQAIINAGPLDPPLYWIGGSNLGDLVSFYWFSAGKKFTFTNWAPGKPDNEGGDQNCVLFVRAHNINQWDDEQCSRRVFFICETRPDCKP